MVTERAVATNVEVRVGVCRFGMGGGAEFLVAQCEVGLRGALFSPACICLQIKKKLQHMVQKTTTFFFVNMPGSSSIHDSMNEDKGMTFTTATKRGPLTSEGPVRPHLPHPLRAGPGEGGEDLQV
jgi:hypothetical protein